MDLDLRDRDPSSVMEDGLPIMSDGETVLTSNRLVPAITAEAMGGGEDLIRRNKTTGADRNRLPADVPHEHCDSDVPRCGTSFIKDQL